MIHCFLDCFPATSENTSSGGISIGIITSVILGSILSLVLIVIACLVVYFYVAKKRNRHRDHYADAVIYTNHISTKSLDNPVYMATEIVVNRSDLHLEPSSGIDGDYESIEDLGQLMAISHASSEDPLYSPPRYDSLKH